MTLVTKVVYSTNARNAINIRQFRSLGISFTAVIDPRERLHLILEC